MKFIHYIEKIGGVDVYGMISLCMFVLFFTIMMVWVFKTKKSSFSQISRIPLDN
ncbi:MAG: CcoQ/FixQ family Cbb3-type cytochrome c oxidase assembly chaperone [Chitinophagaceae bacterium]